MNDDEGQCPDSAKCENAGVDCYRCTRSWYYEEPDDYFMEKEEEDVET